MIKEVFKDIANYEGIYQISDFGNVRSLERSDSMGRRVKEKILKPHIGTNGYLGVKLYKKELGKTFEIHKLVAVSFLNHVPCGQNLVVNHKDFDRLNNHKNNIEIVTARDNGNMKHIKHSSKYTGVTWHKHRKKWMSAICVNNKKKYLGYYDNEYDAHLAYEKELASI